MLHSDYLRLISLIIMLGISAFFSSAEIAILSLGKYRLHQLVESGSRPAAILHRLLMRPSVLLTTILITITVINYTAEAVAADWALVRLHDVHSGLGWRRDLALAVSAAVMTMLVLIWAEVTPIFYASANPERVALLSARPVRFFTWLLAGPVKVITTIAGFLAGAKPIEPVVTEEELKTIVTMEAERGALEEEEKEMIHSIFEFGDTVVREVMVPRIDIVGVELTASIEQAMALISQRGFSRLPVYQGSLDRIVGVVHAKDLLLHLQSNGRDSQVWRAMRTVYFVPETKQVSELLSEFRLRKVALAIVLDEYGGTAGLVTVEDLLEEIVGEIYDEYDARRPTVEEVAPGTYLLDGKLSLREAEEVLATKLPEGDYDTLAGLLYDRLGSVPMKGEGFTHEEVAISVEQLSGHRIAKVRIEKKPVEPS